MKLQDADVTEPHAPASGPLPPRFNLMKDRDAKTLPAS